ncbi:MAG: hypothetical protein ACI9WU_002112 [Myxococcota bacterium]|jgi:hypothetical protein
MSVVLISPPVAKACEPLLGIATLKAFLEARGVDCHCIDANVEALHWLLDRDRMDEAAARLAEADDLPKRLQRHVHSWRTIRPQLQRILDQLRSPEGYADYNRYRTAVTSLNRVVALASAAHQLEAGSPALASLTDYLDTRYCDMDSASVAQAARHPEHNLYYPWFRDELIPRVKALQPTVVGISFIFRNQLLCGAALAGMLQEALPDAHITLGGELVSAWADKLEDTHLLEACDSVIPYEGELPLLALGQGRPLSEVPNIHYRGADGAFVRNPTQKLSSLAEVPAPDYTWAPWDLYLAPERTAPLVTARGCYWNRCTFCPEVVNPETKLRLAKVERIVQDMHALYDAHGVTTFHFIDSALPPRTLEGVARYVAEHELPWSWYGFSRLEPYLFRPGWAELLAKGGCKLLKLGLETASQRLLDHMDKKQDIGQVSQVLRSLRDAGILVHGFLMFGTPYENADDAEQTERFVAEHADCIQFMNCSIMNLARGAPMALDPPAHGIHRVVPFEIPGRTLDLALYDNFEGEGWGRVEARRFLHDRFLKHPEIRPSHLRTPAYFDSNHSVFFHRLVFPPGTDQTSQVGSGGSSQISTLASSSTETAPQRTVHSSPGAR